MMADNFIEVKIKTPNDKKSVKVSSTASVKELRSEISKLYEVSEERLCLIFAGKILKNEELLVDVKIIDGVTVHLVVKQPQPSRPTENTSTPLSTPPQSQPTNQTPSNIFGGLMGQPDLLGMMGGLGGGGNFEEMQRNMQQQLMSNPEMMRSMLENPVMQNLLQSPEVIQSMMQSNPQIRQLMERNPEVGHILNNPSLMRQVLEMMRNPAMVQELMRHHDRALLNAEAFPGGMNHLTRLYRDVQEPLMEATTGSNPFANLANRSSSNTTRAGTENNEPIPNPWSSNTGNANPRSAPTTNNTSPTNLNSGTNNLPSAEGLQNLLGSINDPRIQAMMDVLRNNPQFTEMAIANSPIAANPQLQEQIRNSMPQVLQAFERPEIRNALTNPRVLQAIFQIQQGLQILQQDAPQLLTFMPTTTGTGSLLNLGTGNPTSGGTSDPSSNNSGIATVPVSTAGTSPTANSTNPTNISNQAQMAQMISSMMSIMSANSNSGVGGLSSPPEQMYATQLETMAQMGFPNRQANLRALIETFGDVNAAVNRILQFDP